MFFLNDFNSKSDFYQISSAKILKLLQGLGEKKVSIHDHEVLGLDWFRNHFFLENLFTFFYEEKYGISVLRCF